MRISDWSSDVCSSDLMRRLVAVVDGDGEILGLSRQRAGRHDDAFESRAELLVYLVGDLLPDAEVGQRLAHGFELAQRPANEPVLEVRFRRDGAGGRGRGAVDELLGQDRKSTRLNHSHK